MAQANPLVLQVQDAEIDTQELDRLTGLLRSELLELDIDSIARPSDQELPSGAKGLAELAGWLAVQFGTIESLRAVVTTLGRWATRNRRTVECSFGPHVLKLTGVTAEQQDKIIEAWLGQLTSKP